MHKISGVEISIFISLVYTGFGMGLEIGNLVRLFIYLFIFATNGLLQVEVATTNGESRRLVADAGKAVALFYL